MTDPSRYRGPSIDPDVPDPDGYTWFTAICLVETWEQWRTTAAGDWNDHAAYEPNRMGQLLPDTWVQVRRSPHPQPTDVVHVADFDPRTTSGDEHTPITFAELHALVDTQVASRMPVNARRDLARSVWSLLTAR